MAPLIGSSSPSLWADGAPYRRIHSKLGKSNVDIQWNVENTWEHVKTVQKLENRGRLFMGPPFSANTQIWQSTKPGQKWRQFCEGIGEQKSHKNFSKNERWPAAAGLSAGHRYPTWWVFSNISTGFLCFHFIPFGMYAELAQNLENHVL